MPMSERQSELSATDEKTEDVVRLLLLPLLKKHNCRSKIMVPGERRRGGNMTRRMRRLLGYPFSCHGFEIDVRPERKPEERIYSILPLKEAECRSLSASLEKLFRDSQDCDVVIAVATGGISVLQYLIARWSQTHLNCNWPTTADQLDLCLQRFKVVCGFRSGWGVNALRLGTEAMAELLGSAAGRRVLIVDTTFHRSGTQTILSVLREAAPGSGVVSIKIGEVLDNQRLAGRTLPEFALSEIKIPVTLNFYTTERIVMEDISEAIGYRQVKHQRRIQPLNGSGLLIIQRDENNGFIFDSAGFNELLRKIVAAPREVFEKKHPQSAIYIDAKLRSFLKPAKAKKSVAKLIETYLSSKDATPFGFGNDVRRISHNRAGAVTVSFDKKTNFKFLDDLNLAQLVELEQQGLLNGRIEGDWADP